MVSTVDADGIELLRDRLAAVGYRADAVLEAVGGEGEGLAPRPAQVPLVLRRLPPGRPLSTLIRLFLLGLEVSRAEAAKALAPLRPERIARMGLVDVHGGTVSPAARLVPFRDLVLTADREHGEVEDPLHVMAATPSSIMLTNLTVRRPVERALDLGTGCGLHAILAARHSRRVVATDLNPRALAFTEFNCRLNGTTNVECREGDLFEPVAGEAFELIVANPPFVIAPARGLMYRDSPGGGDTLCRRLLQEAPRHLAPGGIAHVMVGWAWDPAEGWEAPLTKWVRGDGTDAWLIHHSSQDAESYAAGWTRPLEADPQRHRRELRAWLDHLESQGIRAVGYGAAILRRREGGGDAWLRSDDLAGTTVGPAGDQIERLLAVQDRLAALPAAGALLDARLVVNPRHRLEQILRIRDGAYAVEGAGLVLEEGLQFALTVDGLTAEILRHLDGTATLSQAAQEAAWDFASEGLTAEQVRDAALRMAPELLRKGFLDWPDGADATGY